MVHPTTKDSTRRGRGGTAGYKIAINNRPREFFVAGHKSPRQSSPRFFRATFPSSSVLHACRQRAARWPFFPPFVSVVRRRWSISLRIGAAILISTKRKKKKEKKKDRAQPSSVNHRYCRSTKGRGSKADRGEPRLKVYCGKAFLSLLRETGVEEDNEGTTEMGRSIIFSLSFFSLEKNSWALEMEIGANSSSGGSTFWWNNFVNWQFSSFLDF